MESRKNRKKRPSPIKKFISAPKGFVLVAMAILAGIDAVVNRSDAQGLINVATAMLTGLLLDLGVGLTYKRKRLFSDGGLVTGLIVALVLSAATPWYIVAATTAVAIISKHVLKIGRKPIFNPAALGLLIAVYAFNSMQSWWGGLSFLSAWWIIPLAATGILVTRRVKKFPQVIAFLAVYFALFFLLSLLRVPFAADALTSPFVNSALFLAFFMLTDPPTSPAKAVDQVWFGAISGIVTVGVYALFGGLAYLLIGVLTANAFKAVKSVWFETGPKGMKNPELKRQLSS